MLAGKKNNNNNNNKKRLFVYMVSPKIQRHVNKYKLLKKSLN